VANQGKKMLIVFGKKRLFWPENAEKADISSRTQKFTQNSCFVE